MLIAELQKNEPIGGDNAISTVADIGCFAGSQLEWNCNSRLETNSQNYSTWAEKKNRITLANQE